MTHPFCPNCGHDIAVDKPADIDDFSMAGPHHPLVWKDQTVKLTPFERCIVWSLLKIHPEPVGTDALLERMGSEGYCNLVSVLICRIRAKLREVGAPEVIMCVQHRKQRSYVWVRSGS